MSEIEQADELYALLAKLSEARAGVSDPRLEAVLRSMRAELLTALRRGAAARWQAAGDALEPDWHR